MTIEVEIFSRNMVMSDKLKDHVTKKASKLDHYLPEAVNVRVDLTYLKSARSAGDRNTAQLTVRAKRAVLRTEERADDMVAAFDAALDKMQRQMERYKGKHYRGPGDRRSAAEVVPLPVEEPEEAPLAVVRRKTFELHPMSELEALEQMILLGHENFFIFYNAETSAINVLYRRRDGTYGLIEPTVG